MAKYEVGQEVILTRPDSRPAPSIKGVVRKVGRQYVYASEAGFAEKYAWQKFDMETGYEQVTFGSGGRIYTPDDWEEAKLRTHLWDTLQKLGIQRQYGGSTPIAKATSDQLYAIIEILTED